MAHRKASECTQQQLVVLAVSIAVAFGGVGLLVAYSPNRFPAHSIAVKAVGPTELVWTESYAGGPAETDDGLRPLLAAFFAAAQKALAAESAQLVTMSDGTLQFRVFTDKGWATFEGRPNFEAFIASYLPEQKKESDVQ